MIEIKNNSLSLNNYRNIISNQIKWILKLQAKNGAICDSIQFTKHNLNCYKVTPYFANIAAYVLSKQKEHLHNVLFYIKWYLAHLNWPDKSRIHCKKLYGTIYDYFISTKGDEYSAYAYDSADSYAATFISLIRAYCETCKDTNFIIENKHKIEAIGGVMIDLMNRHGLTYASPNHKVLYLMDNCEVYRGLEDMAYLYKNIFCDTSLAEKYFYYSAKIKISIEKKFFNLNDYYVKIWCLCRKKANWKVWYPDSVAELYPSMNNVTSLTNLKNINVFKKLNRIWDWPNLKTNDPYPWTYIGYANAVMGNRRETEIFYNNIVSKFIGKEDKTYWNSMESAWLILMVNKMIENGWY